LEENDGFEGTSKQNHGFAGGEEILEEYLGEANDQPKEIRDICTAINDSFEDLKCFAMPAPGDAFLKDVNNLGSEFLKDRH
jgi:hypothetical protein